MEDTKTRQAMCEAACEGIPTSYVERGYIGLKAWFANKCVEHDTPIAIGELGRYIPWRRSKSYMYSLAKQGMTRKDGLHFKLETFEFNGFLASTIENYFRMQLQMDGTLIVCLEKQFDDTRLCMAMCSTCGEFIKFPVRQNEVREIVCRRHGWQNVDDFYWACKPCAEKICQSQET